jgi:hypothetical protein
MLRAYWDAYTAGSLLGRQRQRRIAQATVPAAGADVNTCCSN